MKITSLKDIDKLQLGNTYTIEPIGVDFNKPESIDFKTINEIQKAIELKFSTTEIAKKTEAELSKMRETDLVAYGLTIGAEVNTKYTKAKNIENILNIK